MLHFRKVIFCTGIAMLLNLHLFSQDLVCLTGLDSVAIHTNSKTYYGDEHTPQGSFKVLVIFCRTLNDTSEEVNWEKNSLPDWSSQLFDTTESSIGNSENISKYYFDLSQFSGNQFKLTGKIFPELVVTPFKSSAQVIDTIIKYYPNFNWGQFDQRTNGSDYQNDNSFTSPDKVIDYVVFAWRHPGGYEGEASTSLINKKVFTNYGGTADTFYIHHGHRHKKQGGEKMLFSKTFIHELAHNIWSPMHYAGANSTVGKNFYCSMGWGMISNAPGAPFYGSNAWENWWLNWLDSLITVKADTNNNGIYTVGDLYSTGQAIRVQLPGPAPLDTTHYLWIENHQKVIPYLDERIMYNDTSKYPVVSKGLYMYITKGGNVREPNNFTTNFIKFLNKEGNFDYLYEGKANIPYLGERDVFSRVENPISGQNNFSLIRWDYNRDDEINVSTDFNGGGEDKNEQRDPRILKVGSDLVYTYGSFGDENDGFFVGEEVGISGNVTPLNIPNYNQKDGTFGKYRINGLRVKVVGYNSTTGEYQVSVKFNNYSLEKDTRWCGPIELYNLSGDNSADIVLKSGKKLTIDRSLTPNSEIKGPDTLFNEPTVLKVRENASMELENNSRMIVKNKSVLHLDKGSLRVFDNAKVVIEEGSSLIYENGSSIYLGSGSKLIIQGDLKLGNLAEFTFSGAGHVVFDCQSCTPGWQKINVIPGNGSKITLEGNGATDTILVVKQDQLTLSGQLDMLDISYGLVALGTNSNISTGCPVNMQHTVITSTTGTPNNHEGFWVNGQRNVTIENCRFSNGEYGIYGRLFYNHGAGLTVTNSDFDNNTYGIWVYSKGFTFSDLTFEDNEVGIWAEGLTFPAKMTSSYIEGDHVYGINVFGGTGDLQLYDVTISDADLAGARISDIPLHAFCSRFANNPDGIMSLTGNVLNIAPGLLPPNGGKNYVGYNGFSTGIHLDDARLLLLNNGENNFTDNKWAITGGSSFFDTLWSIPANKNSWANWGPPLDQDFSPVFVVDNYDIQYQLWNKTLIRPIELVDLNYIQSPAGLPTCGVPTNPGPWLPEGLLINCPGCPPVFNSPFTGDSMHQAVVSAIENMSRVPSEEDLNTGAIEKFHAILTDNVHTQADTSTRFVISLAYEAMKIAFAEAYAREEIYPAETSEEQNDDSYLEMMIEVIDTMMSYASENKEIMGLYLDKVNVYRTNESFTEACAIFPILDTFTMDSNEFEYYSHLKCLTEGEKNLFGEVYAEGEFESYLESCLSSASGNLVLGNQNRGSALKNGLNFRKTPRTANMDNIIEVINHPATGERRVKILRGDNNLPDGEVVILDMNGKEIVRRHATRNDEVEFRLPTLKKGVYLIYYRTVDGRVLDKKRMLIL